jgi:hypothetical protein
MAPFDPIVPAPFGRAAFVRVNIRGVPLFQTEPEGLGVVAINIPLLSE